MVRTCSFRLWYGSDAISFKAVPGGTPRYAEEDPFTAVCSTQFDTAGVVSVTLHVAFQGPACTVVTQLVAEASTRTPCNNGNTSNGGPVPTRPGALLAAADARGCGSPAAMRRMPT